MNTGEHFVTVHNPMNYKYSSSDRVAIIDGDSSHHFPNLAIQKIRAWEKRNGVCNIKFIKLKHKRKAGVLEIHSDSMDEVLDVTSYDRIYASFIFTRSKPVAKQLQEIIPNIIMGGTGVDEYHELEDGEYRSKPKRITQLHYVIENMYPDHSIYESEFADENIAFWSEPEKFKCPKKYKSVIESYAISTVEANWGRIDEFSGLELMGTDVKSTFHKCMDKYGCEDGETYRGSTRGNGYSSKGCPRKCSFCVVPIIQGDIRPTHYGLLGVINWILPRNFHPTMDEVITLYEHGLLKMRPHLFWDAKKTLVKRISQFLTISDNNFTSDPTCIEKMNFIVKNNIAVNFNQGMDVRYLTSKPRNKDGIRYPSGDEICEKLKNVQFMNFNGTSKQLHFAWDYIGAGKSVINGINKLVTGYGMKYRDFLVYCLSGFNTTFEEDYQRVLTLRKLGVNPYIMLFRNVDGSEGTMVDGKLQDWREKYLARWTNNKIIFKATSFHQYENYVNEMKARNNGSLDPKQEYLARLECFDWLTTDYVNHA